jgi:beta-glucosidase-like glycosyl hydrolase
MLAESLYALPLWLKKQLGGVIIFGRNVAGLEQLRSLLDGVREIVRTPPLFGIDQEGGLVDRLRRIFTPMPWRKLEPLLIWVYAPGFGLGP